MTSTTSAAAATADPGLGLTGTDALLALMVLVWAINYIVLKAVLREIEPLAFNALRFTIAASSLALIARFGRSPRPSAVDIRKLGLLGLLGNTIYQFGFIEGLAHTRAGNCALIMAAVPVQTAVIGHVSGHEPLRRRDMLGLAVSSAGIATIILGSDRGVSFGGTIVGDLLVLAATVCWSFYIVGIKPHLDRYGAITVTAWTMGLGTIPMVLLSLPAVIAQPWRAVSVQAYSGLVFSALGAIVLAYIIWSRGIQRLGPARTSMYSNVTPVVVMLLAWPLLSETPTAWQVLGAAGIFTGLWLTRS